MNIKFTYLYRDAANYKQYHEVVFANPNELPIQIIHENSFIAKDWNLPGMHFKD